MKIVNVKHHVLKDVPAEALEEFNHGAQFKALRGDPVLRENWISFTALEWNAAEDCLYLGLTAFDRDLFWRFHPDSATFESLDFKAAARDPQFVKIHRGLTPDREGGYYFGIAGLLDLDDRNGAAGGAIFHYRGGEYACLGVPVPHDYIQNIEVDLERNQVYGVTWPVIQFFHYDPRMRITRFSFFTGSHFHETGLDDDGYAWGTWSRPNGHCLFRYHPVSAQPEFYDQPIPNLPPGPAFTFPMNGPIDSFINGGDGYLYFGTTLGELYRLDPKSGRHTLLGRPSESIRLSGLMVGPEGKLLGSYGAYDDTGLFLYDTRTGEFNDLGALRDGGVVAFMIHDIAWDGGTRVIAGETDNLDRSAYLWEATLG